MVLYLLAEFPNLEIGTRWGCSLKTAPSGTAPRGKCEDCTQRHCTQREV